MRRVPTCRPTTTTVTGHVHPTPPSRPRQKLPNRCHLILPVTPATPEGGWLRCSTTKGDLRVGVRSSAATGRVANSARKVATRYERARSGWRRPTAAKVADRLCQPHPLAGVWQSLHYVCTTSVGQVWPAKVIKAKLKRALTCKGPRHGFA